MAAKWPPPVSLHLLTLLRYMRGLQYFKVFPEWVFYDSIKFRIERAVVAFVSWIFYCAIETHEC